MTTTTTTTLTTATTSTIITSIIYIVNPATTTTTITTTIRTTITPSTTTAAATIIINFAFLPQPFHYTLLDAVKNNAGQLLLSTAKQFNLVGVAVDSSLAFLKLLNQ